jgi:hypothetical protein
VIRDLHLDGGNTHQSYVPGKTPERNHGIFFNRKEGIVENVLIRDCLVENFSGDCINLALGCRNITVREVALRNFIRQGIRMSGGDGARDYLITGCYDLEHSVQPGGSTIHVEHGRELRNVQVVGNRCRNSVLAGDHVDGLLVANNVIEGVFEGNVTRNDVFQGNIVRGRPTKKPRPLVQLGFADGLVIKGNILVGGDPAAPGIYVWGTSRWNSEPSRDVLIADNLVRVPGEGISLNGVVNARVAGNMISSKDRAKQLVHKRTEGLVTDAGVENRPK